MSKPETQDPPNLPRHKPALVPALMGVVLLIAAGVWALTLLRHPPISPSALRQVLSGKELVGMTLPQAQQRLRLSIPARGEQTIVIIPADAVPGWTGGPIELELREGTIVRAEAIPLAGTLAAPPR